MIETQNQPRQGFLNERLTETATELQDVREKLQELNKRIGEADVIIRFYADPRNYGIATAPGQDHSKTYQDRVSNDYSQADNDNDTHVAGRRARKYLKTHGLE